MASLLALAVVVLATLALGEAFVVVVLAGLAVAFLVPALA